MATHHNKPKTPHIAIIGAGFSGAMLLYHLIELGDHPLKITVVEKASHPALGIAYGTKEPRHLLNVAAQNMSAFEKDPGHFFRWAKERESLFKKEHQGLESLKVEPHAYLPRMIYGSYLEHLWQESLKKAALKHITIDVADKEVAGITVDSCEKLSIQLNDKSSILADAVVLAIGFAGNQGFSFEDPRYIPTIWGSRSPLFSGGGNGIHKDSTVAIIGSGLTMLDALSRLYTSGYPGKVLAFSGDGMMPEEHIKLPDMYPSFFDSSSFPKTARELLKMIRLAVDKAKKAGYDWRTVVDSLRPYSRKIWKGLSAKEKKKLFPLLSTWNRHRHRMPSAYKEIAESLEKEGRFQLQQGSVKMIDKGTDGLLILSYQCKGAIHKLSADYAINCSGPEIHILRRKLPLIQQLLKEGLMVPDPLGLGVALHESGALLSKAQGKLFAVGHLLFGELLETTAVPDLRGDCENTAQLVIKSLNS